MTLPTRTLLLSILLVASVVLACTTRISQADSDSVTEVARDLGIPWGMAWVAPGQLIVTDRNGRAALVNSDSGDVAWLSGLPPVYARGQGGLLDVAVPPAGEAGGWIYFTYSKPQAAGAVTTLARARLSERQLTDWQELLVTRSASGTSRHFGSRIAFDGQGHLFFSVGDRGHRPNGQDLMTHAGTILRLNLDGSLPADNPFAGRSDALPEIYSYGHRNPQGLCYDHSRGGLWASEHGPRGGDEINWITAGSNYGWATVSRGKEYSSPAWVGDYRHKAGMEEPRKVYIPSIAPGSLLCYSGGHQPWRDSLFLGALKLTHLNRVTIGKEGDLTAEERLLEKQGLRIRALLQGPAGELYLTTDDGRLLRMKPN
ncbi:PQQ-dependent sugar dehydrogenase [Pseudomaricurvus sp. HS19]|uniref:PQQ-dependent sugar dehydrogenase n=1 Tax=Pseudomaricurvus sp. HS19 TaxID=2692626 RepID=UPI00136BA9FB|nr:PQQ-dependent sugar dehydrogenase [Pseudomaricurvus sp. HS19]MYM64408.1 PQQ-dependent sugar dehydrogenase [Pseudomaricurvus sp. HS19]